MVASHTYTVTVPDSNSFPAIWAESNGKMEILFSRVTSTANCGSKASVSIKQSGKTDNGTLLNDLLLSGNPYGNEATLRVSQTDGSKTYYTDYELHFKRKLSLETDG